MISELYQKSILALAAAAHGAGRLDHADGTADVRNPLCGDHVILDVRAKDGRIEALGHELRACVVCQASASILADKAPGSDAGDLKGLTASVAGMLNGDEAPTGKWSQYADLAGVAPYGNRHRCVLLPIEAAAAALANASAMKGD